MIVAALLLLQVGPTYSEVMALPPRAAGERVLQGQQHEPIDSVEPGEGGLAPPGVIEGQLIERPIRQGAGCVRRRWTMGFHGKDGGDPRNAPLSGTHSTTEIALSTSASCPTGQYVHLNPGVSVQQGFAALAELQRIRDGRGQIAMGCSDATKSRLCTDPVTTRRELNALSPWNLSHDANDTLIWLGTRGGTVTEVRFNPAIPDHVAIKRSVPAPF